MAAPVIPPPLCDGDRLSLDEFLRRWELLPDLKHAQLLDGIVYMASPVSNKHSSLHSYFVTWLGTYQARTPGCETLTEGTVLMGKNDAPQPDIALRILPGFGGQSRDEGPCLAGAPELIVEVAASSRARDLGPKSQLYLQAGVREYLTALVDEERLVRREFHQHAWRDIPADSAGILHSRAFPGLWLDAPAMWRRDLARVLDVLGQGMASAEHAEFAQSLAVRGQT
jgi:Uma2 family endonuclease